jgi:hypothetical protein
VWTERCDEQQWNPDRAAHRLAASHGFWCLHRSVSLISVKAECWVRGRMLRSLFSEGHEVRV